MSIPELIRLLEGEGMNFDTAFDIAVRVFSYTNHTVMAEALEAWDMKLLASVVPELCTVLEKIDAKLKRELPHSGLFVIKDGKAHMADLSIYGSHAVNGVAKLHSEILKDDLFRDWYAVYPDRFQNKTNGITPRRWLGLCDPELCGLLEDRIGAGYLTDLDRLAGLREHMDDFTVEEFLARCV